MVNVPNYIKVRVGIEQGCVYNFSPKDGVSNHYFIVLNRNPKADKEIYLAPFTTKKENVLKFIKHHNLNPKTFVELVDGECLFLPRRSESGVDCNRLIAQFDVKALIELIDKSNGSCNYPKVGNTFMIKIIEGVKASRMVSPLIKSFL